MPYALDQVPKFEGSLSDWATKLVRYLETDTHIRSEIQPQPVLLAHKLPNTRARAASDGIIMHDPELSTPVVSVEGEWKPIIGPGYYGDMIWAGNWVQTTYPDHHVVVDWPYLAISNKETDDRPAPQPQGEPEWTYQGASPINSILAKTLFISTTYTLNEPVTISAYRVYTVAGNHYSAFMRDENTGVIEQLWSETAITTGWHTVTSKDNIFTAGAVLTLGVYSTEPDPTPVAYVLSYNYTTPNNADAPGVGVMIQADKVMDSLRANKTDLNGDQWQGGTGPLAQMTPGDTITGSGMTWAIQTITEETDYVDFTVAPAQQGTDGVQNFTFETVTATPIDTVIDTDYYLSHPNVQSAYSVDGGTAVQTQSAYGLDVQYQRVSLSEDWDILAVSGSIGGSAGEGVPEAVSDEHQYARKNAEWDRNAVEPYSDLASYVFDDLSSFEGTIYHCVADHGPQAFSLDYWRPIAAPVGTGARFAYQWTNNLVTSGEGRFGVNDASPLDATEVHVSAITRNGADISGFWGYVDEHDIVGFAEETGGAEYCYYTATGPSVLVPGSPDYYSIPVVAIPTAVSGDPEENRNGTVSLLISPGSRMAPGGTTGQVLTKASDDSYDTEWTDITLARVHATVVPGSDPSLVNAKNIASVTRITDASYTVNFSAAMADSFYHVDVTPQSDGTDMITPIIYGLTNASFSVKFVQDAYGGPQETPPIAFTVRIT